MPNAPNYIKVNGHVYRRAEVWKLSDSDKAVFARLVEEWLDGEGWRSLFMSDFSHWSDKDLAHRMAGEFGAYVGTLAEEELPWEEYARELKRAAKEKKGQ